MAHVHQQWALTVGESSPSGSGPGRIRKVMGSADIDRALSRIAHEILERNRGISDLTLVGVPTRGVHLADRLGRRLREIEGTSVPVGRLDVSGYRDDRRRDAPGAGTTTHLPDEGIDDRVVILVDDVLYSGRTTRAALDALSEIGRPRAVRLAVLVDRGHRQLPIRADHVGKNLPTSDDERVYVLLKEVDDDNAVIIADRPR